MIVQGNLDFQEGAYYFSSLFPEFNSEDTYLFVSMQNIRLILSEFLKQHGFFTLAILHNLSQTPTYEAYADIIFNIDVQCLFGEVLIKTLIMLIRAERHDLFSKGTENLAFINESEPRYPVALMKEFLEVLCNSTSLPVDLVAVSKCFLAFKDDLEDKELLMLASFLRPN